MTVQGIQQPPLAVSDVLFAVLADGQPKDAVVVLVADRRVIGDPARGDGLTDAAPGERRSRSRPHPLSWRISIEAQRGWQAAKTQSRTSRNANLEVGLEASSCKIEFTP